MGKVRQILKYIAGIGMKDVRSVLVYENARLVVVIVGIPPNVRSRVNDQNLLPQLTRKPFSEDAPSEPRTDNQVIEHLNILPF